jgi:hypothetical protein
MDDTVYTITLNVGKPPSAGCTCGWKSPASDNLHELGKAAFEHRDESGHVLRQSAARPK